MQRGILSYILAFHLLLPFGSTVRADDDCGTAKIISGNKCSDLVIEFDLTGCEPENPKLTTGASCKKRIRTATVKTHLYKYHVSLKREKGILGSSTENWSVKGPVHRMRLFAEAKTPTARKKVTPPASPAVQQAEAVPAPKSSGLEFSAYFDAYYAYNFNKPAPVSPIAGTSVDAASVRPPNNSLRYYDWYSKQLGLNLIELTVQYTRKDVKLLVDLDFGQMADINASYPSGSGYVADELTKHIGQAVLTYTPAAIPGLILELGKMHTHVGLELIKAKDNWNYSRSTLFGFGGPFWHLGFHAGYEVVPHKLTVSGYLYQGWNTIYENNSTPTFGSQIRYLPVDDVILVYNYVGGPEQAGNPSNWKQVHELNATVVLTKNLCFAADILYGSEENVTLTTGTGFARWYGASGAFKYQFNEIYSLSPRGEFYRDAMGYTLGGPAQTHATYTLTNSFKLRNNLEARFEGRYDHSSWNDRFNKNNNSGKTPDQATALIAVLYSIAP